MPIPVAAYSNVGLFAVPAPALKVSGAERKAAAKVERSAEAEVKFQVDRADAILDRLEARAAVFARYVKAYQKRRTAALARYEKIEDEIIAIMEENNVCVLAGVRCSMRLQPAPEALEVLDEALVPNEFMRPSKTTYSVDKVAVKNALAANDELDPRAWGVKLTSKISLIRK